MGEQAADRHAHVIKVGRWQMPVRQISLDRSIEVDPPLLNQPHHPPGSNRLGDRSDLKRGIQRDRHIVLLVRQATTSGPGNLAVVDQPDGRSRNPKSLQQSGHHRIELSGKLAHPNQRRQ